MINKNVYMRCSIEVCLIAKKKKRVIMLMDLHRLVCFCDLRRTVKKFLFLITQCPYLNVSIKGSILGVKNNH